MISDLTYRALLRAVLEAPDDDLPRLALCDWLEENGHEALYPRFREMLESPHKGQVCVGSVRQGRGCKFLLLCPTCEALERQGVPHDFISDYKGCRKYHVNRGLIEAVKCSAETWLRRGPDLCYLHPVVHVALFDRSPSTSPITSRRRAGRARTYTFWKQDLATEKALSEEGRSWRQIPQVIPLKLWPKDNRRRMNFPTEYAATQWLSRRCVNWAREMNGLPELKETA